MPHESRSAGLLVAGAASGGGGAGGGVGEAAALAAQAEAHTKGSSRSPAEGRLLRSAAGSSHQASSEAVVALLEPPPIVRRSVGAGLRGGVPAATRSSPHPVDVLPPQHRTGWLGRWEPLLEPQEALRLAAASGGALVEQRPESGGMTQSWDPHSSVRAAWQPHVECLPDWRPQSRSCWRGPPGAAGITSVDAMITVRAGEKVVETACDASGEEDRRRGQRLSGEGISASIMSVASPETRL